MFTGIIEEIGEIKSFTHNSNGATIVVKCKDVLADTNLVIALQLTVVAKQLLILKKIF